LRITIISVAHKLPSWIQDGYNEYVRRMPPEVRIEMIEIKPEDRGAGRDIGRAKSLECERLLGAVPDGGTLLALDERGKAVTTQGLSTMLSEWMGDGSHPVFAIGGADGLSEEVKRRAARLVSLSALTLPHALVRVVLAEQLYRAWTILARHPYHRE
jgi:23S rRNA (pseudouridine1915-N3)-methyltransferase